MITSLEWLVPISGVMYLVMETAADFTALSAITSPIAAGEPAMNPNASPSGVPKALWIAGPALAEKANSRCPDSLM